MNSLPHPANDESDGIAWNQNERILEWLSRLAQPDLAFESFGNHFDPKKRTVAHPPAGMPLLDDWQTVANICGYAATDFVNAGSGLPLSAAEIDHFRRNHRATEGNAARDFLRARTDLPSPLIELYGLYRHRARLDIEATLFVAQSTGSTRVARVMADLLAIGGFANGLEYISYLGVTYSVPAAFDTSDLIDRANHEAARRLALPASHSSHLLKITPDEIGILAMNIAERHALSSADFMEKANLLSEARQDVTRLPINQQFTTAIIERDLPMQNIWVIRLCAAYNRLLEGWVSGLPELDAVLQ